MIFINGVAFEKVGSQIWIVSCTAPHHRTYTIVSAERQYLCSTYFAITNPVHDGNAHIKLFSDVCSHSAFPKIAFFK
jgi:hypothetical protein